VLGCEGTSNLRPIEVSFTEEIEILYSAFARDLDKNISKVALFHNAKLIKYEFVAEYS